MSDYFHEAMLAKMVSSNAYQQGYGVGFSSGYKQGKSDTLEICRVLFCKYAKGRDLGEIDRLLKEIEEMKDEVQSNGELLDHIFEMAEQFKERKNED